MLEQVVHSAGFVWGKSDSASSRSKNYPSTILEVLHAPSLACSLEVDIMAFQFGLSSK
jgi:hypothetical protein